MKIEDYKKQYEQLEKFILKESNFEIKNGDTITDVAIREMKKALPKADVVKSVCEMCEKEVELQSDNLCKKCYDSLPS